MASAGKYVFLVVVYLCRNSKFCEPISVNGVSHHFSILVDNRSDHSVLSECVRDAEDKFFVTVHCDHWAKKVGVNPEVWTFCNWKRHKRCSFVCRILPLLPSKTIVLMTFNVLSHFRPEVRRADFLYLDGKYSAILG